MWPVDLVGPERTLRLFGVKLLGVNARSGKQLLFSIVLLGVVLAISYGIRKALRSMRVSAERRFWTNQVVAIAASIVVLVGLTSIWFADSSRLSVFLGLLTAGVAFALQRVITSFAGYLVILRGRTFSVGDRITMGGVRGDVIALGFLQTRIMEMGQPSAVEQKSDPAMWVHSRQYTGRIVIVSNDKIFAEPVYNYTTAFPYLWEELALPISYAADRARAEQILLQAASKHTTHIRDLSQDALRELERRYVLSRSSLTPRVYYRITDNWLELTLRFLAPDHGVREIKDAMTRDILEALDEAEIGIASATFEVVGLPPLRLALPSLAERPSPAPPAQH